MNSARTIRLTDAAALCAAETGADWQEDVSLLQSGEHTAETLLSHCLDGADDDRIQGWHEYVNAVVSFANS